MAIGGMEIVYFSPPQLTRGSVGYSHGCADVQGSIVTRGCPSLPYMLLLWVLHPLPAVPEQVPAAAPMETGPMTLEALLAPPFVSLRIFGPNIYRM